MKQKKTLLFLSISFIIFIICAIGFDTNLEVTNYILESEQVPDDLDGFKIVQISDLHNSTFGFNQNELISAIQNSTPDLILFTGDIFSKEDEDFDAARQLITQINTIAPIYSVSGNHEYSNYNLYMELLDFYKSIGVTELVDTKAEITYGNTDLVIYGINQEHCSELSKEDTSMITVPTLDENDFGIVLYHFANQFDELAPVISNYFCVFSGHTHGGIIRLPLLGGVIANDRTIFPKYDGGIYEKNNLFLVSSRGLGESFFPRFNNNPELVCVTLKKTSP